MNELVAILEMNNTSTFLWDELLLGRLGRSVGWNNFLLGAC